MFGLDCGLLTCSTALIVEDEVQLKAGRATPLSLQYWNSLRTLSPVRTPAGTMPSRPMVVEVARGELSVTINAGKRGRWRRTGGQVTQL